MTQKVTQAVTQEVAREVAREMVRRSVVKSFLVLSLSLAFVSLLLILTSQPHRALAKTTSLGALRQTGTGDALSITGTTSMNSGDMEAMGHAMAHLIMALDVLHEMQQQQMINASAMMGDMGAATGMTGTTAMGSSADVGALIEMMGHMAESMGYMHEAMGYSAMSGAPAAAMGDTMNSTGSDLSPMLDILEQMVQATIGQLPTLSGMPGATATGTTTDTTTSTTTNTVDSAATGTATDTVGMGVMTGTFDPSPLLPVMAQTLQAMADQLSGMTGAITGTTGTSPDMMGMGMPTLRHPLQAMGQSLELMGHMHMMMATMRGVGDTGTATALAGDDMRGLINAMAQAMADHVNLLMGGESSGMGATGTTTGTTGMTDTTGITDTTGMTDTTDMTGTTDSDSLGMGMNSTNPALTSAAQLIQITLLQIQGLTGGVDGGTGQ